MKASEALRNLAAEIRMGAEDCKASPLYDGSAHDRGWLNGLNTAAVMADKEAKELENEGE
jgi:hypothetical protein